MRMMARRISSADIKVLVVIKKPPCQSGRLDRRSREIQSRVRRCGGTRRAPFRPLWTGLKTSRRIQTVVAALHLKGTTIRALRKRHGKARLRCPWMSGKAPHDVILDECPAATVPAERLTAFQRYAMAGLTGD